MADKPQGPAVTGVTNPFDLTDLQQWAEYLDANQRQALGMPGAMGTTPGAVPASPSFAQRMGAVSPISTGTPPPAAAPTTAPLPPVTTAPVVTTPTTTPSPSVSAPSYENIVQAMPDVAGAVAVNPGAVVPSPMDIAARTGVDMATAQQMHDRLVAATQSPAERQRIKSDLQAVQGKQRQDAAWQSPGVFGQLGRGLYNVAVGSNGPWANTDTVEASPRGTGEGSATDAGDVQIDAQRRSVVARWQELSAKPRTVANKRALNALWHTGKSLGINAGNGNPLDPRLPENALSPIEKADLYKTKESVARHVKNVDANAAARSAKYRSRQSEENADVGMNVGRVGTATVDAFTLGLIKPEELMKSKTGRALLYGPLGSDIPLDNIDTTSDDPESEGLAQFAGLLLSLPLQGQALGKVLGAANAGRFGLRAAKVASKIAQYEEYVQGLSTVERMGLRAVEGAAVAVPYTAATSGTEKLYHGGDYGERFSEALPGALATGFVLGAGAGLFGGKPIERPPVEPQSVGGGTRYKPYPEPRNLYERTYNAVHESYVNGEYPRGQERARQWIENTSLLIAQQHRIPVDDARLLLNNVLGGAEVSPGQQGAFGRTEPAGRVTPEVQRMRENPVQRDANGKAESYEEWISRINGEPTAEAPPTAPDAAEPKMPTFEDAGPVVEPARQAPAAQPAQDGVPSLDDFLAEIDAIGKGVVEKPAPITEAPALPPTPPAASRAEITPGIVIEAYNDMLEGSITPGEYFDFMAKAGEDGFTLKVNANQSPYVLDASGNVVAGEIINTKGEAPNAQASQENVPAVEQPGQVAAQADAQGQEGLLTNAPAVAGRTVDIRSKVKAGGVKGERFPATYALIEADQLEPSHNFPGDLSVFPNEKFVSDMQARNRQTAISADQFQKLYDEFVPGSYGKSNFTDEGSPVVLRMPDGHYEPFAGNGRGAILKRVYADSPEKSAKYREMLADEVASKFVGIDPAQVSSMRNPVLVRVAALTVEEARNANLLSDQQGNLGKDTVEQARADAKLALSDRNDDALAYYAGDEINSMANDEFRRRFMDGLPDTEKAELLEKGTSKLTVDGARRVEAALLQRAYNDNIVTDAAFADLDPEGKNLLSAMKDLAPHVIRLEKVKPEMGVSRELTALYHTYKQWRTNGGHLSDVMEQMSLIPDSSTLSNRTLLSFVEKNIRSRKRLTDGLRTYADSAFQEGEAARAGQGGLDFGGEVAPSRTKEQLLQDALKAPAEAAPPAPAVDRDALKAEKATLRAEIKELRAGVSDLTGDTAKMTMDVLKQKKARVAEIDAILMDGATVIGQAVTPDGARGRRAQKPLPGSQFGGGGQRMPGGTRKLRGGVRIPSKAETAEKVKAVQDAYFAIGDAVDRLTIDVTAGLAHRSPNTYMAFREWAHAPRYYYDHYVEGMLRKINETLTPAQKEQVGALLLAERYDAVTASLNDKAMARKQGLIQDVVDAKADAVQLKQAAVQARALADASVYDPANPTAHAHKHLAAARAETKAADAVDRVRELHAKATKASPVAPDEVTNFQRELQRLVPEADRQALLADTNVKTIIDLWRQHQREQFGVLQEYAPGLEASESPRTGYTPMIAKRGLSYVAARLRGENPPVRDQQGLVDDIMDAVAKDPQLAQDDPTLAKVTTWRQLENYIATTNRDQKPGGRGAKRRSVMEQYRVDPDISETQGTGGQGLAYSTSVDEMVRKGEQAYRVAQAGRMIKAGIAEGAIVKVKRGVRAPSGMVEMDVFRGDVRAREKQVRENLGIAEDERLFADKDLARAYHVVSDRMMKMETGNKVWNEARGLVTTLNLTGSTSEPISHGARMLGNLTSVPYAESAPGQVAEALSEAFAGRSMRVANLIHQTMRDIDKPEFDAMYKLLDREGALRKHGMSIYMQDQADAPASYRLQQAIDALVTKTTLTRNGKAITVGGAKVNLNFLRSIVFDNIPNFVTTYALAIKRMNPAITDAELVKACANVVGSAEPIMLGSVAHALKSTIDPYGGWHIPSWVHATRNFFTGSAGVRSTPWGIRLRNTLWGTAALLALSYTLNMATGHQDAPLGTVAINDETNVDLFALNPQGRQAINTLGGKELPKTLRALREGTGQKKALANLGGSITRENVNQVFRVSGVSAPPIAGVASAFGYAPSVVGKGAGIMPFPVGKDQGPFPIGDTGGELAQSAGRKTATVAGTVIPLLDTLGVAILPDYFGKQDGNRLGGIEEYSGLKEGQPFPTFGVNVFMKTPGAKSEKGASEGGAGVKNKSAQ